MTKDVYKRQKEALDGRDQSEHGLYDYIVSSAGIKKDDREETVLGKITNGIGIGFDGRQFLFARFIPCPQKNKINTEKLKIEIPWPLNLQFHYEKKDFSSGLKRLALLLRQQERVSLTKQTLCDVINPKNEYVRKSIWTIYRCV